MSVAPTPLLPGASLTPDAVIARLQRDARTNERLSGMAPAAIDRTIERTVRELWATSRVKVFVPILALRQAEQTLTAATSTAPVPADSPGASLGEAVAPIPADAAPLGGAGALAADDVLDLTDDVMPLPADDVLDLTADDSF